jgi:hypothetical protein
MRVYYNHQPFILKLCVRESLFGDLRRSDPDREVEILSNQTGQKLRVRLRDLTLECEN